MKALPLTAGVFVAIIGMGLPGAHPASAQTANTFSVDSGNVAFGYSDGYWDHNRRWHKWSNRAQRRGPDVERYNPWRDSPQRNRQTRDNTPNLSDSAPRNPARN